MGAYGLEERKKKGVDFGSLGIMIGLVFVVVSLVWMTKMTLSGDEEKSGEGVTWVG